MQARRPWRGLSRGAARRAGSAVAAGRASEQAALVQLPAPHESCAVAFAGALGLLLVRCAAWMQPRRVGFGWRCKTKQNGAAGSGRRSHLTQARLHVFLLHLGQQYLTSAFPHTSQLERLGCGARWSSPSPSAAAAGGGAPASAAAASSAISKATCRPVCQELFPQRQSASQTTAPLWRSRRSWPPRCGNAATTSAPRASRGRWTSCSCKCRAISSAGLAEAPATWRRAAADCGNGRSTKFCCQLLGILDKRAGRPAQNKICRIIEPLRPPPAEGRAPPGGALRHDATATANSTAAAERSGQHGPASPWHSEKTSGRYAQLGRHHAAPIGQPPH